MIVGCYVRVSTTEQAREGYSITEQSKRLTKYCEAHDWQIYKIYSDPGYSGSNMNRPALKQMLNDVEEGKLNKILVYKLDRLSRSQKDTLYLIEDKFLANDVDFSSMHENFDSIVVLIVFINSLYMPFLSTFTISLNVIVNIIFSCKEGVNTRCTVTKEKRSMSI